MTLRLGKTKATLNASIDSALLAVEIYNKPRTTFRSQAYISLMIMAWTRLFHAHFNQTIGDKYYYKKKNQPNRYETIDGERKAWELTECLKKYNALPEGAKKNLEFFIKLRNKVEHRHIDPKEIDVSIFGECQSLLFNYENALITFFGSEYSINEALVYSLQFSQIRTQSQKRSAKTIFSRETENLLNFIRKFRESITQEIFDSPEFSIRLIQIPKISNSCRTQPAVEFIHWNSLDQVEKEACSKLQAITKDKKVKVEAVNIEKLKPGKVVGKVKELAPTFDFNSATHTALWKIFAVRPETKANDKYATNPTYCFFDETHEDYVYTIEWAEFIVHLLQSGKLSLQVIRQYSADGTILDPANYGIQ